MKLSDARALAESLVEEMRPHCLRVEIAGSIRRGKDEVKDLEIVAIPKWREEPGHDLFASPEQVNALHEWALSQAPGLGIQWIKPATDEQIPWLPRADGKYWRAVLRHGIKFDLFLATKDNFGLIYLIRTGSAAFSEAVVTHAKRIGLPCREGFLRERDGAPLLTPEEISVFCTLGLQWVEPEQRTGPEALRTGRAR